MERPETFDKWLLRQSENFTNLSISVSTTLASLLYSEKISYLSVNSRVKDIDKCLEKVKRKGYRDPKKQMTDVAGVRVVVYFEDDVKKVSDIIHKIFDVDKKIAQI